MRGQSKFLTGKKITPYSRVCSRHFKEDYITTPSVVPYDALNRLTQERCQNLRHVSNNYIISGYTEHKRFLSKLVLNN